MIHCNGQNSMHSICVSTQIIGVLKSSEMAFKVLLPVLNNSTNYTDVTQRANKVSIELFFKMMNFCKMT